MPLFLAAVFLSAFLLFQVQPVVARYILPWYGGSPGVWTTCLLFFQSGLLAGYAYAHGLVTWLRTRRSSQAIIHLTLLLLACLLLPITPSDKWKPDGTEASPIPGIVGLLSLTVGIPYVLLAASGPLLQHWFAESHPDRSPYRLYSVSNLGSLLGLLTYPFLFEPLLALDTQTQLWSWSFALYAALAGTIAIRFLRRSQTIALPGQELAANSRPTAMEIGLWIAFSACGSMLLMSLTSQMCQDVAVVPFLWVAPLSLYLLTFIIAFDHARWYLRSVAIPGVALAVALTVWLLNRQFAWSEWPLSRQIAIYCGTVFFSCLVCHGELVRLKPLARHLTGFYLAIALGGALGGLFVNLIAPRIFSAYWELHLTFGLLAGLITFQLIRSPHPRLRHPAAALPLSILWVAALVCLAYFLRLHILETRDGVIAMRRGFYGSIKVEELDTDTKEVYRTLLHGRISHGRQYLHEDHRGFAATYYGVESGVGTVFESLPARLATPPQAIHVGVIGLGVGTIATYAEAGDRFRFYEINPQVEELARSHFTFLADCQGEETVVLGDARITLERELYQGQVQQFDALFVDAFSGDSIPIHLLTKEAFSLYFQHLKPDGVLVIHITNLHIDLSDPVRNLAEAFGREAFRVEHNPGYGVYHSYYSDWVIVTNNREFISALTESGRISDWDREERRPILWTDQYSNLFEVTH